MKSLEPRLEKHIDLLMERYPVLESIKEQIINAKIDNLLSTMYYNKYQKDIKEDDLINVIYQNCCGLERCYFNQSREEFSKTLQLQPRRVELDNININEIIDSPKVDKITYSDTKVCSEEEYKNLSMGEITSYNTLSTTYKPLDIVTINLNEDNNTFYVVNGLNYTKEEALGKGYLEKVV